MVQCPAIAEAALTFVSTMGRHEPPPEEGAPLWMCTYGDLMSLLLCFFIMLFAISIIAEVKWEAFIETQEIRMGYSGQSSRENQANRTSASLSTTSEMSRRLAALVGSQPTPGKGGDFTNPQTILPDGSVVKGGLVHFEWGNDELTVEAKKDLEALLPTLSASSRKIMVKGYAAPTEAEKGGFDRDFYLSYDRAINVKNYLISLGLKEEFFLVSMSDSAAIPNRAILPPGTDPKLAGASAGVFLLDGTQR